MYIYYLLIRPVDHQHVCSSLPVGTFIFIIFLVVIIFDFILLYIWSLVRNACVGFRTSCMQFLVQKKKRSHVRNPSEATQEKNGRGEEVLGKHTQAEAAKEHAQLLALVSSLQVCVCLTCGVYFCWNVSGQVLRGFFLILWKKI